MNCQQSFKLTSTHKNFNDKQKDLFKELDKVNVMLSQSRTSDVGDKKRSATSTLMQPSLKHLRGKESIFKRPEIPLKRCLPSSKIPDFQKHPHKWTKYTLDDVKDEDISEIGNKRTAYAFLKELENRSSSKILDTMEIPPTKITFQKSQLILSVDKEEKIAFKNSKVVMPEYVVGQKMKRERKNREKRISPIAKELTLTHLTAEDDEA
ncbi:hypothetical protein Trydic_g754 [Trypoxylus dichotomus]